MRATPDVRLFIMQKNRTGPPGIYHLVPNPKTKIYIYNWIIGICYLLVATYIWWITFGVYLLLLILFLEIQKKKYIYLLLILVFGNHFCWVAYLLIG